MKSEFEKGTASRTHTIFNIDVPCYMLYKQRAIKD